MFEKGVGKGLMTKWGVMMIRGEKGRGCLEIVVGIGFLA